MGIYDINDSSSPGSISSDPICRRSTRIRLKDNEEYDGYFEKTFVNTNYHEKCQDVIKLNKAVVPRFDARRTSVEVKRSLRLKETATSLEEIATTLKHHDPRRLCPEALWALENERRDKVPKRILRYAKQLQLELNPDFIFTKYAKNIQVSIKTQAVLTIYQEPSLFTDNPQLTIGDPVYKDSCDQTTGYLTWTNVNWSPAPEDHQRCYELERRHHTVPSSSCAKRFSSYSHLTRASLLYNAHRTILCGQCVCFICFVCLFLIATS